MVKNISGGKKAKGMARKNAGSSGDGGQYRITDDSMELHGVVTKILGNGFFYVDVEIEGRKKQLLGHIRNKFKAKNKRNNMLGVGCTVIVGLREWESEAKNCDLLFITGVAEGDQGVGVGCDDVVFADGDEITDYVDGGSSSRENVNLEKNNMVGGDTEMDLCIDDI